MRKKAQRQTGYYHSVRQLKGFLRGIGREANIN